MTIENIKNVNITVLFSSPLNHLLINQKGVLSLYETGDQEKDKNTLIEAPGLKVFTFPTRKKDLVFEGTRILISDKSEVLPRESDVIDDFEKIIDSGMVEKGKIVAYGFNYDVVVSPKKDDFQISDLISDKISKIPNIKSAGVSVSFRKGEARYVLEIKPIGDGGKFIAHFNAHFNVDELPGIDELRNKIIEEFVEFNSTIEKI